MEIHTLSLSRCWLIRAFGRNPLVRSNDRVEALLSMVLVVVALLLLPVAGAIGTAVYDSRGRVYAEQSRDRHQVTASLVEDATVMFDQGHNFVTAPVRWRINGTDRVDRVDVSAGSKVDDQLKVWVDLDGNRTAAPTLSWHAGIDAWVAGFGSLLAVLTLISTLWVFMRAELVRQRNRGWDRELQIMAGSGGGRTGHHSWGES